MARESNLTKVFEESENYIGEALKVIRILRNKSKLELAYLLSKEYGWECINANLVGGIECGAVEISFEQLEQICTILGCSIERILRVARELRNSGGMSEKELLEEMKNKAEYQ